MLLCSSVWDIRGKASTLWCKIALTNQNSSRNVLKATDIARERLPSAELPRAFNSFAVRPLPSYRDTREMLSHSWSLPGNKIN